MLLKLIPSGFFSRQARKPEGVFGRYLMSYLFRKGNEALNRMVLSHMEITETDCVLEVGFGPGSLIKALLETAPGCRIYGIDFSRTMLQSASKLNQSGITSGQVQLILADSTHLPFPDHSFNKLCTVNTIYFWSNPQQQLKELYRVLKPGGKLVIGFRDAETLDSLNLDRQVFQLYSTTEVTELLNQSGFDYAQSFQRSDGPLPSKVAEGIKAKV
ncbi:class I SAM-dependent methyltransferase [Endozoicomonas arenosclerae]|uniref:class I SAM-dependent methyltransferase n=1 Tax=Endozoicomonas arenosclerae TaxID=1633495 RepID=UPI000781F193|nr:class I SAM-dependent methyltransferase [Endozoicomonas arenosclerae]